MVHLVMVDLVQVSHSPMLFKSVGCGFASKVT